MDTLETIAKHRAEIGNEAAVQWVTLHFLYELYCNERQFEVSWLFSLFVT